MQGDLLGWDLDLVLEGGVEVYQETSNGDPLGVPYVIARLEGHDERECARRSAHTRIEPALRAPRGRAE